MQDTKGRQTFGVWLRRRGCNRQKLARNRGGKTGSHSSSPIASLESYDEVFIPGRQTNEHPKQMDLKTYFRIYYSCGWSLSAIRSIFSKQHFRNLSTWVLVQQLMTARTFSKRTLTVQAVYTQKNSWLFRHVHSCEVACSPIPFSFWQSINSKGSRTSPQIYLRPVKTNAPIINHMTITRTDVFDFPSQGNVSLTIKIWGEVVSKR